MKIEKGATLWARQTIESDIFFYKPDKWFKIWFYIVNRVNFMDDRLFEKGSALITYEEIMIKTKATKSQVEKCLKWLKKEDMLEDYRTTRGRVRIVKQYNKYQDIDSYRDSGKKSCEKSKRRVEEELENVPIGEEGNNGKNDINDIEEKTPKEKMNEFKKAYEDKNEFYIDFVNLLVGKYSMSKEQVAFEIEKFYLYWTEKNKSGKSELWETKKTFEVDRRLYTWFNNNKGRNKSGKTHFSV